MVFAIWIVCPIICAVIGNRKGEGGLGFICGLIFGPLGILLMLVSQGNRKKCDYCRELIHRDAVVCAHCQKDLREHCPHCNKLVDENWSGDLCPHCEEALPPL